MKLLYATEKLESPHGLSGKFGEGKKVKRFDYVFTPGEMTKVKDDEFKAMIDEKDSVLKYMMDNDLVIEKVQEIEDKISKAKEAKELAEQELKKAEEERKQAAKEMKQKQKQIKKQQPQNKQGSK